MVLNVYVDAFNLYYGCLKEIEYKWLNLRAFCQASFPADQISRIRYFTARIPANPHDPDKPERQATYFRALQTEPVISIHEGQYLTKIVRMPQHPIPPPPTPPTLVRVIKTEEKGSDVNLATHLLVDAADNDFEGAVVVTNDSDLVLPIKFVRTKFKRRVFVLHPCTRPGRKPSIELRIAAGLRSGKPSLIVQESLLGVSQFPAVLTDAIGDFHKPSAW